MTVVYIRDRNAKGQEISSYIDYALRLHEDDFASIFAGRQRLSSKITDLSHFNWDTNVTHSNNSPNFDVIFHGQGGIRLKCKKDRRVIHLDPNRQITDTNIEDSTRTLVRSGNYAQVSRSCRYRKAFPSCCQVLRGWLMRHFHGKFVSV